MTTIGARKPVANEVLTRLKAVVGPSGYLDQPTDIAPYCDAFRGNWVGDTPLVLRPSSTEEVAALVRICAETRTPIVPQSGITGLTGASQPHNDRSEVVINTQRMNRIRAIDTANDTITVDAGVILRDIQLAAADVDRLFPLSLGAEGSCRIGGNISTNAGGNNVLRYGNTRALVLGIEAVLPDGQIWNGLRGLRKDNTGYDLKHLFIGGEGTLGIVTGATLRLFPKPTDSVSAFIGVASPNAAVELLSVLRGKLGESISAFELMHRKILDLLLKGVPGHSDPMPSTHPWYVLTEVAGQTEPGTLNGQLADALGVAMESGLVQDALITTSGEQARKLWKMREDLAEAQKSAGGSIGHDISVPVSRIPEFIERADAAVAKAYPGVRLCCFGHVGDGNLHYNPIRPVDWTYDRFHAEYPAMNKIVHDIVVSLGGSISAEHGIGRLRLEENYRYKSPVEIGMMTAIKQALDPHNIMNPGKVLRG